MRVLGMISGTSHDGIDSAVVDVRPVEDGLELALVDGRATPYPAELRARLVAALPPAATSFAEVCALDTRIGQVFAAAAAEVAEAVGGVELVVSHGQTVFHWVEADRVLGTLQVGEPAWIAERTGLPVVSDVRSRDVAAGGQGAPLASTIDRLLLAGREGRPAALNLGGISNVTVVAPSDGGVRAWDIGPANALLDAVVLDRAAHPDGYDAGGAIAATGTVDATLLEALLDEPYYRMPPPKTTGKELFHLPYLTDVLRRTGRDGIGTADLLATLTRLTVCTVADALAAERVTEVFASGGGVRNATLLEGLAAALPGVPVRTTDELGLPADHKEAVLMALVGWLTVHGVRSSVPSATGASGARLLGSITPGAAPLRLPAPAAPPRFVRMTGP